MGKRSRRLTQALLATTCLTAVSVGPAHASLVSEPPEFPASEPGAALLVGTDQVTGSLSVEGGDADDFFTFTGLSAGQKFTLTYDETEDSTGFLFVSIPSLGLSRISDGTLEGNVPLDGNLTVRVHASEQGGGTYSVTLEVEQPTTATPAPSTLALSAAGAALGGALGWRRRTHGRSAG